MTIVSPAAIRTPLLALAALFATATPALAWNDPYPRTNQWQQWQQQQEQQNYQWQQQQYQQQQLELQRQQLWEMQRQRFCRPGQLCY